jgi:hypothetical protein
LFVSDIFALAAGAINLRLQGHSVQAAVRAGMAFARMR